MKQINLVCRIYYFVQRFEFVMNYLLINKAHHFNLIFFFSFFTFSSIIENYIQIIFLEIIKSG